MPSRVPCNLGSCIQPCRSNRRLRSGLDHQDLSDVRQPECKNPRGQVFRPDHRETRGVKGPKPKCAWQQSKRVRGAGLKKNKLEFHSNWWSSLRPSGTWLLGSVVSLPFTRGGPIFIPGQHQADHAGFAVLRHAVRQGSRSPDQLSMHILQESYTLRRPASCNEIIWSTEYQTL